MPPVLTGFIFISIIATAAWIVNCAKGREDGQCPILKTHVSSPLGEIHAIFEQKDIRPTEITDVLTFLNIQLHSLCIQHIELPASTTRKLPLVRGSAIINLASKHNLSSYGAILLNIQLGRRESNLSIDNALLKHDHSFFSATDEVFLWFRMM